jgi:hypothetical protein
VALVDLAGRKEYVDQVVRARCDPQVYVQCHELPDDQDPSKGVLIIEIPPSDLAPHMVDNAYHGRSDSTKYRLGDAEVERLHALRRSRFRDAEQIIQAEIDRDPTPWDLRQLSHLYVVAEPVASRPDLLEGLIDADELNPLVRGVFRGGPAWPHRGGPDWSWLSHQEPRAGGRGWHSGHFHGRVLDRPEGLESNEARADFEKELLDIEVTEEGRVALFVARGSVIHPDSSQSIFESLVVLFARAS